MRKLAINLLGNVVFRLGDGPPLPLGPGKTSALLAYLTIEAAHPHPRHALAALLWPERSDVDALGALRFALSNLRTVVHDRDATVPFLLIDRARVQINPQAEVWVDAVAFRERAAALRERPAARHERQSACEIVPSVEALRLALALYQGPFLQGFNLGDSLDFESWALRMRDELERERVRLLHMLGAHQEAAGEPAQAAEVYRAILESRPWDEAAHRRLMRALAANGEYGAALAQYMTCHRALDDLGIEPGRATNALYQRLKREQAAPSLADEPVTMPFVARERELARLDVALERALSGQGQVILITGEAGSGKTALLNAFARQALARHPDLLVAGGRCDAYTGVGRPYQPFVECVRSLAGEWDMLPWLDQIGPEGRERLQQAAAQTAQALVDKAPDVLARFVDRVAVAQRTLDQESALRSLQDRHNAPPDGLVETERLFEQIAGLFTTLARQHPLVLLLDDLQWSDAGSASLLFCLARCLIRSRILLVVAYRPGEVASQRAEATPHPLLGIATELQRYGGAIRVDLDQVDERAFVTALLEQDPQLYPNRFDAAFRTALARRTGGNPLFTIELLRSLQSRGEIRRAMDGSWVSSPTLNWKHLPERVEAAIAGRIAHLPDEGYEWLITASVEGESFTAEVLARVHSVEIDTVTRTLNGILGMGRGALRLVYGEGVRWLESGDPPQRLSRYRFRHSLFQAYLYQQLGPAERAQRHAAVGFVLEDLYGTPAEERVRRAAELAHHFEAGGLPEKAAAYHLEAGRQAVFLAALPAAVAHYRSGLALLDDVPRSPARDRLETQLHLALGAPFLTADGWGGAERQAAIRQALALLAEAGSVHPEHPLGDSLPDAGPARPTSTEWAGPEPAEWEVLPALYAKADWLTSQGELEQADRIGGQILALSGASASLARAMGHRILGMSCLFQGRFPEARRQLEKALSVYRTIGRPATFSQIGADLEGACQTSLGFVLATSGYLDRAWQVSARAINRARRMGNAASLGSVLIFVFEVAVLRGDLPALDTLAGELLRVGQAEGRQFFRAYGWAAEGYVHALQAQPGSAQAESGLDLIRRGMRVWQSSGTQAGYGMWIVRLADACLQTGDIEAGLALTADVLAEPSQPGIAVGLSQIHRLHGELLLRQAHPDRPAAAACFEQALEISRRQEAHTLELHAALSLAKLWQAAKPETARRLLAGVYAWFTEGLDTPVLVAAREWLARY